MANITNRREALFKLGWGTAGLMLGTGGLIMLRKKRKE